MKNTFTAGIAAVLPIDYQVGPMGWVKPTRFEKTMKRNALAQASPTKLLTLLLSLCATGCMLAFPHMMRAQVSLPTVNLGDTNFEDGIAGPGFLAEEFPGYYTE